MPKIECTAVNELVDLVQRKPLDRDSAEDLFFSPPTEARLRRTAAGTQPPPVRGLFAVELPIEPTEARATMPKISTRTPQFEATPRPTREEDLATTFVPRQPAATDLLALVKKLALPAAALLVVGIGIGAAVKMTRKSAPASEGTPVDIAAAFTPPKIVVAPKILPPPVVQKPKLVDVRLESTPPGAMATLLDTSTGNSTPLGATPVEASVDASKSYDVRFELDGRPSQTQHLDPSSNKLEVALAAPEPAPAPVETKKSKKHRHRDHAVAAKKAAAKRVATAPTGRASSSGETALAAMGPAKDKKAAAADAPGTLSITASVPCAILLDGANIGASTPAKLSVPAGHHSVRLIAATQHINKQFGVDVVAKKTTRLDQTF